MPGSETCTGVPRGAERIQITGGKIAQQFQKIESAELDPPEATQLKVVELREDNKGKK